MNVSDSFSGFDMAREVFLSRAPGRLDLMGGVSDYSGGLCLEWPTREATFCALQLNDSGQFLVESDNAEREGWTPRLSVSLSQLMQMSTGEAHDFFKRESSTRWAALVGGAIPILREAGHLSRVQFAGATLWISSQVPAGAGVSSSASVEVAAMQSLCAALEIRLDEIEMARLCQRVENQVAGAPCGIMDQMTVALGRENQLLQLLCQPHHVLPDVSLPHGVEIWAIDSRVKHSVGGAAYSMARCAAFMGRRVLREILPQALRGADDEPYLANLSPDIWRAVRETIPIQMHGRDFSHRYSSHEDSFTQIEPDIEYSIRLATEHPIYEIARVRRFVELLESVQYNPQARLPLLAAAGDLMIQSHFSYAHRCNLGSPETDLIVQLGRERQSQGIIGAKITGGGAGGTVALLVDTVQNPNVQNVVREIAHEYAQQSAQAPRIFSGSSEGATEWGVRRTSIEKVPDIMNEPRA